jgi:hypothetical protein
MSAPTPPPGRRFRTRYEVIEDMVDDQDFEDSAAMSLEALEADLRERGLDPQRMQGSLDKLLAGYTVEAAPAAPVVSLAAAKAARAEKAETQGRPRKLWPYLLVAAAAGALLFAGGREVVVAIFAPDKPVPTQTPVPVPTAPPVPPEMIAANALRKKAADNCAKGYFRDCLDELNDAAQKDPAGETSPDVLALRAQADQGLHPDASADAGFTDVKPLPGKREHAH